MSDDVSVDVVVSSFTDDDVAGYNHMRTASLTEYISLFHYFIITSSSFYSFSSSKTIVQYKKKTWKLNKTHQAQTSSYSSSQNPARIPPLQTNDILGP